MVEKRQAERRYKDAVTEGDSAILLEEVGPGLYTVSVGNLMAGESTVIRYRYALLLAWQGDQLRFMLPTTIAPRYGDPLDAGFQPHQVPTASLLVDYPLDISISVEGELAGANLSSPSHAVAFERSDIIELQAPRSANWLAALLANRRARRSRLPPNEPILDLPQPGRDR